MTMSMTTTHTHHTHIVTMFIMIFVQNGAKYTWMYWTNAKSIIICGLSLLSKAFTTGSLELQNRNRIVNLKELRCREREKREWVSEPAKGIEQMKQWWKHTHIYIITHTCTQTPTRTHFSAHKNKYHLYLTHEKVHWSNSIFLCFLFFGFFYRVFRFFFLSLCVCDDLSRRFCEYVLNCNGIYHISTLTNFLL